jgi:hypothetical protein
MAEWIDWSKRKNEVAGESVTIDSSGNKTNWNNKPTDGVKPPFKKFVPRKKKDPGPPELYLPFIAVFDGKMPESFKESLKPLIKDLSDAGYTVRITSVKNTEEVFNTNFARKELVLAWQGFEDQQADNYFNTPNSYEIAKKFHPTYDSMKPVVQAFLARNARLVLGKELKSVPLFMLTWTADGAETFIEKTSRTGFIGHPMSMCHSLHIPVFNLAKPDAEARLRKHFLN